MKGIIITAYDRALIDRAHTLGLAVTEATRPSISYEHTLIVGPGAEVPWELLEAAWGFLEKWEAAAPLWRYGVLAKDVGTEEERERTRALTLDLRIPLYEPGLLFLRKCQGAEDLLAAWLEERADGEDGRLAFLRALYRVKPLFLALPRSWLGSEPGRR